MPKNVQKNSFEKMCDNLDKNYKSDKNEIPYVREYVKSDINNDFDMLLKIKAEALEDDYSVYQANIIAIAALAISVIGTIASLLPDDGNEGILSIIKIIYLCAIVFLMIKMLILQHFKTVSKWRKYVLIVIEEMLCEQKKEKKKKEKRKSTD